MPATSAWSCLHWSFEMAAKHPRQATLMDSWGTSSKKRALDPPQDEAIDSGTESESGWSPPENIIIWITINFNKPLLTYPAPESSSELSESCPENLLSEAVSRAGLCCSSELKPFQPTSPEALRCLVRNGWKFLPLWFEQYPWLTVCTTRKVYCFYCKFAMKHNLIIFSTNGNPAFTYTGFNNWKKAH